MPRSTGKPKRRESEKEFRPKRHQAPGKTIESRESQLISLATDVAAEQMRKRTATSQVIVHFLKLGSTLAELEKAKLEHENKLLQAKTEAIKSQKKIEDLYANALNAMRSYQGKDPQGLEEDIDED